MAQLHPPFPHHLPYIHQPPSPNIRQLLQHRSQHAPGLRDSTFSDVSAEMEDTPSMYSRGEFSPALQYHEFPEQRYHRHHQQGRRPDTSSTVASLSASSAASRYSPSRALVGLLPVTAEPEDYVHTEKTELSPVPERREERTTIVHSGSGWFEEETETETDGEDDELEDEDLGGEGTRDSVLRVEKVHFLPSAPITVAFPSGPAHRLPAPDSPISKTLPSPTHFTVTPEQKRPPPASPGMLAASPTLVSSSSAAPLTSHLSYTGPRMTFLSPAPWEEDDGTQGRAEAEEKLGERRRKLSEDSRVGERASTIPPVVLGVGKHKLVQLAMGRRGESQDRDRAELKGLGLIGSPAAGANAHTASSGSSHSAGSIVPPPAKQGKGGRSRPTSPVFSAMGTSTGPAKKGVGHKFSLPRLRHAFQAQSQPATAPKALPLPSPSTESFTSSIPSPSPLETDFPRTPTSASNPSLSLHPFTAQSPRLKGVERERERLRSLEDRRSATMPEQGGAGITLISLNQARQMQMREGRLPTPREGSAENLHAAAGQGKEKEKVLKGKRSFLRLFNSPNNPTARESKEVHREGSVPPVPALPPAYLALPSPAMTVSSGSSPQSSPPQAGTSAQGQSIRERRQAARPSPPLEVNVLISRATNSDPAVATTAAGLVPQLPLASAPPALSQFLGGPTASMAGLEVLKTPRTPAPPPLTLRPVSTAFSAGFAGLIGEANGARASPAKLGQLDEHLELDTLPRVALPKSAPASTATSPVLRPSPGRAFSADHKDRQSAEEVIASLQAQISASKRAWARRVEQLEGEVESLRTEVGRLEGLVRNESHVCDRCAGKL